VAVCVLAGVGAARLAEGVRIVAGRVRRQPVGTVPATLAATLALLAALVPAASPALDRVKAGAERVRSDAEVSAELDDAVGLAGGRERVLGCGGVFAGPFEVPFVAWTLHVHTSDVALEPQPPGVAFRVRLDERRPEADDALMLGQPWEVVARTRRWDVLAACGR
jgi:hypothetical protein